MLEIFFLFYLSWLICKNFVFNEITLINSKGSSSSVNENKILALRKLLNLVINLANRGIILN